MEEVLLTIHTTNQYDSRIDFSVYPRVDKLSERDRKELLGTLEKLAKRLKNNQYPFKK